ncbi:MAG: septal ring lytic transglycosylase RlpA family protein [Alphaproteobacteria bacterium]|nr:septal ring lytic transglycosylase RlpA family protein [Alphaproteobacteria bacterium]QQS56362.1 MAG: septal ring lytic transglycosylase RlpA family protein [Alphaproteobacteria bacterium]
MQRLLNIFKLHALLCFTVLLSGCTGIPFFGDRDKIVGKPGKSVGAYKVGAPYRIKGVLYKPQEYETYSETGIASWYGPGFQGKSTANGERFDTGELTAAHRTLPMPSLVRVTNLENGKAVFLRVNDRGPYAHGRIIDVSQKGAELLAFKNKGIARVKVELMKRESAQLAALAKKGVSTKGHENKYNGGKTYANRVPPTPPPTPSVRQVSASPVPIPLDDGSTVSGHVKRGVVYPDPVVEQKRVQPTTLLVQVASFAGESQAQALAEKLQPYGSARVYPGMVNGRPYYRVRIPARDEQSADVLVHRLEAKGYEDCLIVVE